MATGIDDYGQGIALPGLTDQPSIAAVIDALQLVLRRTTLTFASASARNAQLPAPGGSPRSWRRRP